MTGMELVNGGRHLSFEPQRREPVSLERFWDEVAWQRRSLEAGDTLVANAERRSFTVRYRAGGLPAERHTEVTPTGADTTFLSQHQWGEGTGKVGCGDCGAVVRVSRMDPAKLSGGELADRVVDLVEARARLDGEYLAALGELAARDGAQGAAHLLREMTRMTAVAARGDARLALDLKENDFGDIIEALRGGEVNASHARVIAREAPKKHRRSETEFLELCRAHPADIVSKHPFVYESNEMYADLAAEQTAKSRDRLAAFNTDSSDELLTIGETAIAHGYSGDMFTQFLETDDPEQYVYFVPAEGGTRWIDNMAIPFDAPSPCTAHTFINWLLTGEQGAALSNWNYYGTPNTAALDGLDEDLFDFITDAAIRFQRRGAESPIGVSGIPPAIRADCVLSAVRDISLR